MRSFLILCSGIFEGLYLSWPRIIIAKSLEFFNDIIAKISEDKISNKAVLEISSNYLIKSKNKNMLSKFRIVSYACFR